MIERPPENKSRARGPAEVAIVPEYPGAIDPEDVRRAREEFAAATEAPAPAPRRVVGRGTCPECRAIGDMIAVGVGDARKIRYEGCRCGEGRKA